jgi:hypothetical protein
MALHERLSLMVQHAPPGTLIPVDWLRALLEDDRPRGAAPDFSLEEVADRCAARGAGGKAVQAAAVRKWIREGLRGVRLEAFLWGKTYRVREDALDEFIRAVENAPPRHGRRRAAATDADAVRSEIASSRRKFAGRRTRP